MTTRILVSGPGLIGRQHARIVRENEDACLVAIVAPPHLENEEFARAMGVPLCTDLEEAIRLYRPDGAVLSCPNMFHYDQALVCLERGIPALLEKPMTDDLTQAEMLVSAVARLGVPLLIGHHRTYSPLVDLAKSFLSSPQFGRLVALQGSALFMKPDHYFEDGPWRKVKGGGPILINLIHEAGLMRSFAGEVRSVQAVSSRKIRNFEVEDTVAISLEFASGALGTFLLSDTAASSKSWEMTAGENPAYPFFADEACYHIAGTNGSIDFPNMVVRHYPHAQGRSWWKPFELDKLTISRADPLVLQMRHFVDVIAGRAAPRVSAFDGFQNMRVLQAIITSIETRKQTQV